MDFVIVRENTEGVYMDMGGVFKPGTPDEVATQEDINTRKGVERIIRFAFELAKKQRRKKVLMADKSNVMTYAGGLWQRVFKQVGEEYPGIERQHMFVDALCLHMVRDPRQFDVIVTNNMFGDIITDLAAALQGGLGVAPAETSIPGARRCSSRCMARRRPLRTRTSPTPWAPSKRRHDAGVPGPHRRSRAHQRRRAGVR